MTTCDKSTYTARGGVNFVVTSITDDADLLECVRQAEFLVVTKLAGGTFDHYGRAVDAALGGLLSQVADGWNCQLGSYRLLCLPSLGVELGGLKYIQLIGLGTYRAFHGKQLCGFTRLALTTAARCGAQRITFMEAPYRSTQTEISLSGTTAIMGCRAAWLKEAGYMRKLQTVEYLACPQAKPHLQRGLAVTPPRCAVCTDPKIPGDGAA